MKQLIEQLLNEDLTPGQLIDKYLKLSKNGIAKEVARVLLPEGNTVSRVYINGTIRSWIHYIEVRDGNGTQKEHIEIANQAKKIFSYQLPTVAEALGWTNDQT